MSGGTAVHLSGIAWGHTRGYLPMVATAQRFGELHADVLIRWETRSLEEFADASLEQLTRRYDLLVIDHPFAGRAARHDVLLPLEEWVPADFLAARAAGSVGASHASYHYGGHQWALATDAAAPISGWRPDLLQRAAVGVPRTWSELLALASRGLVALPAIAIDSLMHFYMLCGGLGEDPFQNEEAVVGEEVGVQALAMLRQLLSLCHPECYARNPIATWQLLSSGSAVAYCPFAYGYSNYLRPGYAHHVLATGGLITMDNGRALRSTLGGAGLAISICCRHREVAAEYAQFVAHPQCQRSLYFDAGGQPGCREAWLDEEVNRRSHDFFRNTLPTLDAAYLRPRFDGYLRFQERAGDLVHRYLRSGGPETTVLRQLNELLRQARAGCGQGEP